VGGTPYEQLSRAGQTRRMRRLATTALAAYPFTLARVVRLAQGWNATFRVDGVDGARYALRIHRPDGPTTAMVRSELMWLAAIRRDTDLVVPEPVPTNDGDLVTVVADPDIPEPRTCDLLRWIDGRFIHRGLTPAHLHRVGAFMGHLQAHGQRWPLPDGFTRGRVDNITRFAGTRKDNLSPEVAAHAADLVVRVHSARGGPIAHAVLDMARAARNSLAGVPEVSGLMHADLHQENFLFAGVRVGAIDFDDCGFGSYLYDLAVTLSELTHRPGYRELRAALIAGYRTVRPLTAEREQLIGAFIALRFLQLAMVIVETRENPMFRDTWAGAVAWHLDWLERYLASGEVDDG